MFLIVYIDFLWIFFFTTTFNSQANVLLQVGREEDEARTEALTSLEELQETQNKLQTEIQKYRDSDPEVLTQMKENIKVSKSENFFFSTMSLSLVITQHIYTWH